MATLLVAAGIHRLDGDEPARALVTDGPRITWVGADPRDAPPVDATVDLGGAWVTPCFVDAHIHATNTGLAVDGVDGSGVGSAAELLDRLRRHVEDHPDRAVLLGSAWDDFGWPEGGPPSAAQIAAVAPGRTVLLARVDGHSCLVDPATLARLPLDRLFGVDRDAHGEPTGWLREEASEAAQTLVRGQLTPQRLAAARHAVCAAAAALGIGSFHEMGHPGLSGLDDARAWRDGDWPLDVQVWWAQLDLAVAQDEGLRPGGDLFLDGSIGSCTAAMYTPYGAAGSAGELFYDDDEVAAWFSACTRAGVSAGVHAIGERAIEQAVAALERVAAGQGSGAVRRCHHRVEHLELPNRAQVSRLAVLGVVASVQPAFDAAWGGAGQLYEQRFGRGIALCSNPFVWFQRAGVPMAFGSDSTVTPMDPWGAVAAAEQHRGGLGVGRLQALTAHTLGGRFVAGQDDVGPLAVGRRADLAVWDADPLAVADVRTLRCLATVVRGRSVAGDIAWPAPDGAASARSKRLR